MISIVYIVWGFFLVAVARDPGGKKLFIDFTLAANVAHFGLMGFRLPSSYLKRMSVATSVPASGTTNVSG